MTSEYIIVGLSGGVDSAVAALDLLERGHRVEGLFMQNWDDPEDAGYCPLAADLAAAENAAARLGIPLHKVEFTAEYWHRVFERFLAEYAAGRTPNPDVLCNREIKFRAFLEHARGLGADAIATGHYARIDTTATGGPRLLRGRDMDKDQSYFLHAIDRAALAHVRFPFGNARKADVRARARQAGLANHDRPDSTGICFIGERPFNAFLGTYLEPHPGTIETVDGEPLGTHRGLMHYTIGQRQGLGLGGGHGSDGRAWYVLAKDTTRNVLTVGQGGDHPRLYADTLDTEPPHWLVAGPRLPLDCSVQVRYRQRPVGCRVSAHGHGLRATFEQPLRAIAPGQSAVFYDGDLCLGGAVIERAVTAAEPAPVA